MFRVNEGCSFKIEMKINVNLGATDRRVAFLNLKMVRGVLFVVVYSKKCAKKKKVHTRPRIQTNDGREQDMVLVNTAALFIEFCYGCRSFELHIDGEWNHFVCIWGIQYFGFYSNRRRISKRMIFG